MARRLGTDDGTWLLWFVKLMLSCGVVAAVAALLIWPLGGDGLAGMAATIGFWSTLILAIVSPGARPIIDRIGNGLFTLGSLGILLLVGAGVGAGIAAWFADGLVQSGAIMGLSNGTQWIIVIVGALAGAAIVWIGSSRVGKKMVHEAQVSTAVHQQKVEEGRTDIDGDHLRGAKIAAASAVAQLTGKEHCHALLGNVPIPTRIEPYHFLLSGGTGSGKSQAFFQLMQGTRERGQRAVVVDVGGEFVKRFWRPGDTILNPMDARGVAWLLAPE